MKCLNIDMWQTVWRWWSIITQFFFTFWAFAHKKHAASFLYLHLFLPFYISMWCVSMSVTISVPRWWQTWKHITLIYKMVKMKCIKGYDLFHLALDFYTFMYKKYVFNHNQLWPNIYIGYKVDDWFLQQTLSLSAHL